MNLHQTTSYDRAPRDWYPTPPEAASPLLGVVGKFYKWVEPCAGDGALMKVIPGCVDAYDILPLADGIRKANAFNETTALPIITNPPFNQINLLLHHWLKSSPEVWLLHPLGKIANLDWQWAMRHCTAVLPIGRVVWIPGTKTAGFVDHCWACYAQTTSPSIRFYPREKKK